MEKKMVTKKYIKKAESPLTTIRRAFEECQIKWVEPTRTTVGEIYRGRAGNCRGLYYIGPALNLYFGRSSSPTATISGCRFRPHYAKLKVDLAAMYGPVRPKKEPQWTFPLAWKRSVVKHLLEGVDHIPSHYEGKKGTLVTPTNLDFKVKHRVEVDNLPVLVWDLDHLTPGEIEKLEGSIIAKLKPCCNA